MHIVIDSFKLDHRTTQFLNLGFDQPHELRTNAFALMLMGNYDLHQIIGLNIIVLLEVAHDETDHFAALFQNHAQRIFPAPYLMDAFIGGFLCPLAAFIGVVMIYVEWYDEVNISFCHHAAGHF